MADLSLNSLSVDAIQAEIRGSEEDRLKKQAANNVIRQREAANIRGDTGKKPAASSSKPPPPQKTEKPDPNKEVKELAECIQKVESFMNNQKLGPRLRGIAVPRNGTLAEYKVCLEQIRNKLGEGLAGESIKKLYVGAMNLLCPLLEKDTAPASVRLPPNSSRHLQSCVQNGAFEDEFEELAIEYSRFFKSGPIPRLLMGTFYSLMEYKGLCDSGIIDPASGQMNPEIASMLKEATTVSPPPPPSHYSQAESSQSYFSVPITQQKPPPPEIVLPPPTKIYHQPQGFPEAQIEPIAPQFGFPSGSSRESFFNLDPEPEVEIKKEDLPKTTKKSTRGKGRQL